MIAHGHAAMREPKQPRLHPPVSRTPIPQDVRKGMAFLREAVSRPLSMADLTRHTGVAGRTLTKHFLSFLGVPPMRYLQQLRLVAARNALLAGGPGTSVTAVAEQYCFRHQGRFAERYRRAFGETPSATLRRRRAAGEPGTTARGADSDRAGSARNPAISPQVRERISVAVLPCRVPANEPQLQWLAESVADAVAAALSSLRTVAVTAPTSRHLASMRDPRRVAHELSARYVLSGRVVRGGARLRFTLSLVDTATGYHVWGDSFDGVRDDPLAVQDQIVSALARGILPRIRGAEIARVQRTCPQDLDPYGLVMRALPFIFASRPDATRRALELLHRAIDFDPDYGLATALAAWGHGQLVMYNGTEEPADEIATALQLLQRAEILDSDDPLDLTARCAVHTMAREFDTAEALVSRALALDPSLGWAWSRSAWLHSYRGNSETALEQFNLALSLEQESVCRANNFAGLGSAHFNAERYEAAAFWLRRALLEQPGMWWANRSLSVSYARLGERPRALDSLDALRRSCSDLTVRQVVEAVPFTPEFLDRLGEGLSHLGLPP